MLPRKSISCWLHRCLPARWEETLMQDSWTWDRHQPSAHASRSCIFSPSLFNNDDRKDCIQHQPRSPQASEQLSQVALLSPQSPPELLIEKAELPQQPVCTSNLWYRSWRKILNVDWKCSIKCYPLICLCTANIFAGKICGRPQHSQPARVLAAGPAGQDGCPRPAPLWHGCLLQPRPRGHHYGAVSVK